MDKNRFNETELDIMNKQNSLICEYMSKIIKEHKKIYADQKAIQKRISRNFSMNRLNQMLDQTEFTYRNIPTQTSFSSMPDYSKFRYYGVSRDRNGHALILNIEGNSSPLFFYIQMLGTNDDGEPVLFNVGRAKVLFLTNCQRKIMINIAEIHAEFRSCGLGRILLQFIENFACDNSIPLITLESYLNRTELDEGKCEFDKNLYFYATQGYEEDYDVEDFNYTVVPMKKSKLSKSILDYGFDKPLIKLDKHDDMFKMRTFHDIMGYKSLETTVEKINQLNTSAFHPIVVSPTEKSLSELQELLSNNKLSSAKTF